MPNFSLSSISHCLRSGLGIASNIRFAPCLIAYFNASPASMVFPSPTSSANIAPLLKGLIDTVSISLNAPTAKEFYEITKSKFGIESYDAMKKFAVSCKAYIPNVVFTVVDCIGEEDIKASQRVCDDLGIKLRVRAFE